MAEAVAYFQIEDASASEKVFIVELHGDDRIGHARKILSGEEKERVHIQGTVVKETADYNPEWTYHIDPETIDFFAFAIEVCDATMEFVEENLDDIGGATLPNCHWCPWSSNLVGELKTPLPQ